MWEDNSPSCRDIKRKQKYFLYVCAILSQKENKDKEDKISGMRNEFGIEK
jgi:hypothetical protein